MNFIERNALYMALALITFLVGVATVPATAQDVNETVREKVREKVNAKEKRNFCSDENWSDDDHVSYHELRETTTAASGTINVDGRQNGGISVIGEDRSDVLVRACIQSWGKTADQAKSQASGITINTAGTIKATSSDDGKASPSNDQKWSVSFDIRVPRNSNINLTAHNGGISIQKVDGNAEFETMNGGVFLNDVAGNFKGHTMNGGVVVKLAGSSWRGAGLDVVTTNGGVNILMPENYSAHVETGTVNGGFNSDIAGLQVAREEHGDNQYYRPRKSRISTDLNGGGAPVRVITTNGGVRISSNDKD
jgi:hypothetical protein